MGVVTIFRCVGVAGKLPTATPTPAPTPRPSAEPDAVTAEARDAEEELLLLANSNFADLERDFVDFLLTLLCDDLFSSSGLPAPRFFIVSSVLLADFQRINIEGGGKKINKKFRKIRSQSVFDNCLGAETVLHNMNISV